MSKALSITQLNNYLKGVFDDELILADVLIFGEVTGLKVHGSNAFFTLRDADAQISCVCFSLNPNYLFGDGDKIEARGTPRYYTKGGKLSFVINTYKPYGKGDLLLKKQLLKERLQAEGVFNIKKNKPKVVHNIGVVTSELGAVIHDIINVTTRRDPSVNLYLFDARVQGEGADAMLARAIELAQKRVKLDALIIARGGGAVEDLDAFNSEIVARTVSKCNIFTVSAVGHETDYTLCDFAADMRAPTPSAAAELLTRDIFLERENIINNAKRLNRAFYAMLKTKSNSLAQKMQMLRSLSLQRLSAAENEVVSKAQRLSKLMLLKQSAYENKVQKQASLLCKNVQNIEQKKQQQLNHLSKLLDKSSPLKLLNQGYAKVVHNDSNVITVNELNVGDKIDIFLSDGVVYSEVEKINKKYK